MRRWIIAILFACLASASARAAPPLEVYAANPAITMVEMSLSGDRFASLTSKGAEQIVSIREADGSPVAAISLGDAKVRGLRWAGDDHLLIVFSNTLNMPLEGLPIQEMAGLLHFDVPQRKSTILFRDSNTMLSAVFGIHGTAQVDGKWFLYVGAIRLDELMAARRGDGPARADLYRIDLDTHDAKLVALTQGTSQRWVLGADGGLLAHGRADAKGANYAIFEGDKEGRVIAKSKPDAYVRLVSQGRSPGTLLIIEYNEVKRSWKEVRLDGQSAAVTLQEGEAVSNTILDPQTGLLVGFKTDEGPGYSLFDSGLQARIAATRKAFPSQEMSLVGFGRNMDRMVVFTHGADDPGTYWLVDIAKKSAVPIGATRPEIKAADVAPMRMVSYKAADGLALDGLLTVPPGRPAKGLPLVVVPHPGPTGPYNAFGFDWIAQAFASRGYAVFEPNYRGSGNRGAPFVAAADGEFGGKMLSDINGSIAMLAADGIVDPKRVCIAGLDYGGYAALAGVTLNQGLYRCAVSVGGVTDLPQMVSWTRARSSGDLSRLAYWRRLTGFDDAKSLAAISPISAAARADAPILLIHGKDDSAIPVEQSQRMERALRKADKTVELVVLTDQDHGLTREATRIEMLKKAVAFVQQHNPPD